MYLGREEALTEHAMGWNKRKICNLPKYLALRYAKECICKTLSFSANAIIFL